MRAICPGHNGPVDVPYSLTDQSTSAKVIVFNCPICEEEVILNHQNFDDYRESLQEIYSDQY